MKTQFVPFHFLKAERVIHIKEFEIFERLILSLPASGSRGASF